MFTNYAVAPVLQTNYQFLLYGHCTYQNNNNGPSVINIHYATTQRTLLFLILQLYFGMLATRIFLLVLCECEHKISEQKSEMIMFRYCLFRKKDDLTFE